MVEWQLIDETQFIYLTDQLEIVKVQQAYLQRHKLTYGHGN